MNNTNFFSEEAILTEIARDVENLKDNHETELINYLYENTDKIEDRINSIIEGIEYENEVEFEGDASDYIDYYIDRLSLYVEDLKINFKDLINEIIEYFKINKSSILVSIEMPKTKVNGFISTVEDVCKAHEIATPKHFSTYAGNGVEKITLIYGNKIDYSIIHS